MERVRLEKLIHGGQALGTLQDGRKVLVWGALPGEEADVRIIRSKKSYAEAIAEKIHISSKERQTPAEENYLATSPWQILDYEAENRYKRAITEELFTQAQVSLPVFTATAGEHQWHYRNKMEYSFYGDERGIHLALYNRGSHQKQIVQGSKLAVPAIDAAANVILTQLNQLKVRAGDLKALILRCSQKGEVAAALYVKPISFPGLDLPEQLQGLRIYHSNPQSPASVPTKLLFEYGNARLKDPILGTEFVYDVESFFQVNVPVFESALQRMSDLFKSGQLIDMYAGVGTIGLSLAKSEATLVELDPATATMAQLNVEKSPVKARVVEASTEKALEYITAGTPVSFDPPRAGLHKKVIERLLAVNPPQILYLSCNPATQARDIALLQNDYRINYFEVFNFFPKTPHIESLAVMIKKL